MFSEIVYRSGNCIHDSPETLYVFAFLFPSRCESGEGGAEPFSPESPGGSQLYSEVQFFCHNEDSAVVPAESRSLISLFFIASGMKQNERLSSTVNSKEQYSTLHITASQLEDSATYLCAVEAQCSQAACSLYPNCSCLSPSPPQYYTIQVPLLPLWVSRFIIQHFFL